MMLSVLCTVLVFYRSWKLMAIEFDPQCIADLRDNPTCLFSSPGTALTSNDVYPHAYT